MTSVDEILRHNFHVLPTDLDENFHMNNSKYLSYMEYARTDIMFRSGLFKYALKNKIMAVVANTSIVYRRPLNVFQKFEVQTQIVSWNDEKVYFEHTFKNRDHFCARAIVECRIISGNKIPFSKVIKDLGMTSTDGFNKPLDMTLKSDSLMKTLLSQNETAN
jgi:YbgC/YbaW family acyl-CoA thioester hydrolase